MDMRVVVRTEEARGAVGLGRGLGETEGNERLDVTWIVPSESLEQKTEGQGSDGAAGVSALTQH